MNVMLNIFAMGGQAEQQSSIYSFGPLILLMVMMYIMIFLPQRRRDKERRAMMENLKKDDRIIFSGGILGTVASVKEKTLIVKVSETLKLEITRSSVGAVLTEGQEPGDAALEQR